MFASTCDTVLPNQYTAAESLRACVTVELLDRQIGTVCKTAQVTSDKHLMATKCANKVHITSSSNSLVSEVLLKRLYWHLGLVFYLKNIL
jgi:hypothetical protein